MNTYYNNRYALVTNLHTSPIVLMFLSKIIKRLVRQIYPKQSSKTFSCLFQDLGLLWSFSGVCLFVHVSLASFFVFHLFLTIFFLLVVFYLLFYWFDSAVVVYTFWLFIVSIICYSLCLFLPCSFHAIIFSLPLQANASCPHRFLIF